ncbi:hypothetical protein J6590_006211 [Homalodisca vitripennis]|nr:hypothetical protein J6590_006211 [Homalodisca vitripennis]
MSAQTVRGGAEGMLRQVRTSQCPQFWGRPSLVRIDPSPHSLVVGKLINSSFPSPSNTPSSSVYPISTPHLNLLQYTRNLLASNSKTTGHLIAKCLQVSLKSMKNIIHFVHGFMMSLSDWVAPLPCSDPY